MKLYTMKYYATTKRVNDFIAHHLKYSFKDKKDFLIDLDLSK